MKKIIFYLCFFFLLPACATIGIKVDIYDGGPAEMKGDMKDALARMKVLKTEAEQYVDKKEEVYQKFFDLYLNLQKFGQKTEDFNPDEYTGEKAAMQEYFKKTRQKLTELFTSIDRCSKQLGNEDIQVSSAAMTDCQDEINAKLQKVKDPLDKGEYNEFYKVVILEWEDGISEFSKENIKLLTGKTIDSAELDRLKTEMLEQISDLTELGQIERGMKSDIKGSSQLEFDKAIKEIPHPGDLLAQVRDLKFKQFLHSQSEDYGDPVWKKIVERRENRGNWKRIYGKTKFAARGNSAVIIARDNPVDFKIKQGENDPKALIKGQLIVSRSLVDVGLALSGLKKGVNVPQEGEGDSEENPDTDNELELLKKENQFYDKEVDSFHESLMKFEEELIAANEPAEIESITKRLKAHLQTYNLIFEKIKSTDDEKK